MTKNDLELCAIMQVLSLSQIQIFHHLVQALKIIVHYFLRQKSMKRGLKLEETLVGVLRNT